MKKRLKDFCVVVLSLLLIMSFGLTTEYAYADSDAYNIQVAGYLKQSDAKNMMILVNNYRVNNGKTPLKWDRSFEPYSALRAAELSIMFSFTRPNGEDGLDYKIGQLNLQGETISSRIETLINTESDFRRAILRDDIKSFSGAVFKTRNGDVYYSLNLITDESEDTTLYYDDDEYVFDITVKDGYLNCDASLLNNNLNEQNPDNLKVGKTYNYWIYNYNERVQNRRVALETQYSHSSNVKVASIDEYGTISAKKPGFATLTIKPAEASGIEFSTIVAVVPSKISSVKTISKKSKSITISWKKQSGATGYQIYRSTKKNSGYKEIKRLSGSAKSFTDKTVKKGKTYYYKVRGTIEDDEYFYPGAFSSPKKCKSK